MEDRITSLETQVTSIDARIDYLTKLVELNAELIKCALVRLANNKDQYDKLNNRYKQRKATIQRQFSLNHMTVGEAQALNEAARRTCEFETTSEVGDEA